MGSPRREDISGKRFGLLTVLRLSHVSEGGLSYWVCICDCGNIKTVRASHLKCGDIKTCGCVGPRRTHGEAGTRLYHIWTGIRARCENPNEPSYRRYGGRGIGVCPEWKSYAEFSKWARSSGYSDDLSIDRIDNNKGYHPSNCRWATSREQANNTRKTRLLTHNNETLSVSEWARRKNMNQGTLNSRINTLGWSTDDALERNVRCPSTLSLL